MIIYLGLLSPAGSSDLPESTTGRRIALCSVLLRMGFTCALPVTREAVSSYLAFPPLPCRCMAVYFCCTGLGVTSTGRYPASCPMKPGLSSPGPFRLASRDHLFCLRNCYFNMLFSFSQFYFLAFLASFFFSSASIQMVQAASPVILTQVRPISRTRSIPATKAIPSTGSPTLSNTIASIIIPDPGTPAVPIEASTAVRIMIICCPIVRSIPKIC